MNLKTILCAMSAFIVLTASNAQIGLRSPGWSPNAGKPTSQSVTVNASSNSLSVLFLRDGLSNDYAALAYPLAQVTGLPFKVNIVGLGAYNSKVSTSNTYFGTGAEVRLFDAKGYRVSLYGGLKGLNARTLNVSTNRGAWVFGAGVTIPIN